jgi:hypothetical protein
MNPWAKNPQAALNPGPFAEGDRVRLVWGVTPVEGTIIEDCGNIGVRGRRLYRVRVQLDDVSDPLDLLMAAEELTLVAKGPADSRNGERE